MYLLIYTYISIHSCTNRHVIKRKRESKIKKKQCSENVHFEWCGLWRCSTEVFLLLSLPSLIFIAVVWALTVQSVMAVDCVRWFSSQFYWCCWMLLISVRWVCQMSLWTLPSHDLQFQLWPPCRKCFPHLIVGRV